MIPFSETARLSLLDSAPPLFILADTGGVFESIFVRLLVPFVIAVITGVLSAVITVAVLKT
ncbi:hypothetical protein LCGC14_3067710, partial [marine sediment metagenome]